LITLGVRSQHRFTSLNATCGARIVRRREAIRTEEPFGHPEVAEDFSERTAAAYVMVGRTVIRTGTDPSKGLILSDGSAYRGTSEVIVAVPNYAIDPKRAFRYVFSYPGIRCYRATHA
jgi:hypothetical protein